MSALALLGVAPPHSKIGLRRENTLQLSFGQNHYLRTPNNPANCPGLHWSGLFVSQSKAFSLVAVGWKWLAAPPNTARGAQMSGSWCSTRQGHPATGWSALDMPGSWSQMGSTSRSSSRLPRAQVRQIMADGGEGVVLRNPAVTRHEVGMAANAVRVKSEFLRALRQRKLVDGRAKD